MADSLPLWAIWCNLACKAELGEVCSHVGAILYALLASVNKSELLQSIAQQLSGITGCLAGTSTGEKGKTGGRKCD